jgi:ABC-type phosphate transport system substrate-binding protein
MEREPAVSKQICLLGLAVLLLGAPMRADERPEPLAIIVNRKTSTENVTSAELSKDFRGERSKDADGNKIVILMREHGSPERAAVLKGIYRMTDKEYQTYFIQATFTGQVAAAPKKLNTAHAVRQFVADNPGAIGYVRLADVDDTVKVLKIDGRAPGDEAYGLKMN